MYDKRENYKGELHIKEKHLIVEGFRVSHLHHQKEGKEYCA